MPFKKIIFGKNKGKYSAPSGRVYSGKQVKAYYATDGFKREPKGKKKKS